jgi:peptidoglycan hydrolase CwlO-like protein
VFGAACTAALILAAPATADLGGQIQSNRGKDRSLQGQIGSDSRKLSEFQGQIGDLRERLSALEQSLAIEQSELVSLQSRLRGARAKLVKLKLAYTRDRAALVHQLIAQYETDRPDLISVVLSAHSWSDLLETSDDMKAVSDQNSSVIARVKAERTDVTRQAKDLSQLTAQQERVTAASLTQRDEVDALKMDLIARASGVAGARARKQGELVTLRANRKRLEDKLASLQAQAASFSGAGPGLPASGAPAYSGHGGAYGFFPAAGTNYSVGNEPAIAARLDVMGKALHLHLIGISGYRSPQHSVEVGGFADDPHTRGAASDTPGVEGVAESTLNHYGLTRPFPGPAEADHVQLD